MFANWCAIRGECPLPATPTAIGKFVDDIASLGIERVWDQVQTISREHYVRSLPDPCYGPGPVSEALIRCSGIKPPASWLPEPGAEFMKLPYPVQLELVRRDKDNVKEIRRAQRENGELRKELEKLRVQSVAA